MGTPDPNFHMKIRDLGPQIPNNLGTLGSPISYDIRDPHMWLSCNRISTTGFMSLLQQLSVVDKTVDCPASVVNLE